LAQTPNAQTASSPKLFVLDTNVLLHNPNALFAFDDNTVVIPFPVIEELDKFKKASDDVGRHARQVIRHLDGLRGKGKLSEGVKWNGHGGLIKVDLAEYTRPDALREDTPDNRIIAVAWHYHSEGQRTFFISKDINARIKSDTLGITTQDFEAQKVDADRLYTGYIELQVDSPTIDSMYSRKELSFDELRPFFKHNEDSVGRDGEDADEPLVFANEFVILKGGGDESHTGLARRPGDAEIIAPIAPARRPVFGVVSRNVQQTMALDLLLDDSIRMVTLLGKAGTGKTLLAVAAGMQKILNDEKLRQAARRPAHHAHGQGHRLPAR
jgi:PhoH-like ATPase